MVRHFLDIHQLDAADLRSILDDAHARKAARKGWPQGRPDADAPGKDRVLAMIFEKNSTRTRFSFDAAIRQLGGAAIIATASDMQLGRGEPVEDTARVLSRMVDAVMIRANSHEDVERFARVSTVPVINGLTDHTHPCQLLADVMAFEQHRGPIKDRVIAWSGDGNNMASSWIQAAVQFDFELRIACPPELGPPPEVIAWARAKGGRITVLHDPAAAVAGADAVVTDTWVSMGDEDTNRHNLLAAYRVDEALMARAGPDAVFMHCLPAHRGEEVTAGVIDGPRSIVWDEAENRMHTQMAVLSWCLASDQQDA